MIVDAACQLAAHGHDVRVFTSHHDKNRCFEETVSGKAQNFTYVYFVDTLVLNTVKLASLWCFVFYTLCLDSEHLSQVTSMLIQFLQCKKLQIMYKIGAYANTILT